jgi:hypothetical protein
LPQDVAWDFTSGDSSNPWDERAFQQNACEQFSPLNVLCAPAAPHMPANVLVRRRGNFSRADPVVQAYGRDSNFPRRLFCGEQFTVHDFRAVV